MSKEIAKTKSEWWELTRAALRKWNSENHEDDNMGIQDWIGEIGESYGWTPYRDRYGDWDIILN